ncbi:Rab-GTPase-TBC domain containing protein [Perkinsus sp. BL_2016]|nr:Rab-GTPase-TBC domain containing protein [Perkinsus sp. BL_2016]
MNFLAGLLLRVVSPAAGLRDFYRDGFPLLMNHLEKEGISPSLFLHQWYLSLFVNCLPFPTVLILWDSQLLVKQASLITIPKGVLRLLTAPLPVITSPPRRTESPWTIPVIPIFNTDESATPPPGPSSPSLFDRVSSAFSWNSAGSDD